MSNQIAMPAPAASRKEYYKFGLVIAAIVLVSTCLAYWQNALTLQGWLRWFMGVFFVIFASFKFIGYNMFTVMFRGYDLLAMRSKAYAYAYPFLELGLGLLYIFNFIPMVRDLVTLAIMSLGAFGVARTIQRQHGIQCACLGNIIRLPLSTTSLVEDVGMAVMALVMLILSLLRI